MKLTKEEVLKRLTDFNLKTSNFIVKLMEDWLEMERQIDNRVKMKEGYYWIKHWNMAEPQIIKIIKENNELKVLSFGGEKSCTLKWLVTAIYPDANFIGPLEYPNNKN
jgi:hypothetical protein